MSLQIHLRSEDPVPIVSLEGDLDYHTVPLLEDWLEERPLTGHVVFDLGPAELIDSTGIQVLIRLWKDRRAAGHQVVLAGMTPRNGRVVQVKGLSTLFACYDTPEEAVAALMAGV